MPIHITIDAPDAASALLELRTFLNSGTDIREIHSRALAEVGAPIAAAFVDRRIVEEFQNATTAAPETKKRGRPKKSETPAGGPKPADQAQVSDNSASAPAASTPTAEGATTAAPVPPPSEPAETVAQESSAVAPLLPSGDPASLSFQQFKDEMLAITNLNPNVNLGHCTKAINDHGFARVKDLKDAAPEIYASVIKKAKELVAA